MYKIKFYIIYFCIVIPSRFYAQNLPADNSHFIEINNSEKNKNIDSTFFSGIEQMLLPGIGREEFIDVCAIQWNAHIADSTDYIPQNVNLEKHLTYNEFEKIILELDKSDGIKCFSSSLKTVDNRNIYCLEMGTGSRTIVLLGGIHAREVANPQFLLKFACILVNGFEIKQAEILTLLSDYKIIILPNANPDGYSAAIEGSISVRNKELFFGSFADGELSKAKSNANGVDLNRNFPSYSAGAVWTGDSLQTNFLKTVPSLDYFAGKYLGSEPETKIVMNFIMRYIPIAQKFVDIHSAGRLIYAGKPHLSDEFNNLCRETGEKIRNITNYTLYGLDNESSGEGTDGSITDFAAEVASGYIYNENLGRLAPPEKDSLIRKYEKLEYPCSVNTVETLRTSRKEGFGLQKTSTPKMQAEEWEKYNLEKLFFSLITD